MTSVFPTMYPDKDDYGQWSPSGGLSKREYFAAAALQGFLSNSSWTLAAEREWGSRWREMSAQRAVEVSDALLKRLEEK